MDFSRVVQPALVGLLPKLHWLGSLMSALNLRMCNGVLRPAQTGSQHQACFSFSLTFCDITSPA